MPTTARRSSWLYPSSGSRYEHSLLAARHAQLEQISAAFGKERVILDMLHAALEHGTANERRAAFGAVKLLAARKHLSRAARASRERNSWHQLKRMLSFLRVDALKQIPASEFPRVEQLLERSKRRAA